MFGQMSNGQWRQRTSHIKYKSHSSQDALDSGWLRRPYDVSSITKARGPMIASDSKRSAAVVEVISDPTLCMRSTPWPSEWGVGGTRIVLSHLGGKNNNNVPGPYYLCRSADDAARLADTVCK